MASIVERFEAMPREGVDPGAGLVLRRGASWASGESLSRFHYRGERPATVCEVLVMESDGEPVACLVVSRPVLNAWWRGRAWPGVFDGVDKREAARRVNDVLRTISRVIVDPRYRGIGLATRLVRAYLARPRTPLTEAVGKMSRVCPFFERAGMTAHHRGVSARDARLRRVLREEGVGPAALLAGTVGNGRVERALRVWAEASRATRGIRSVREMACAAAAAWRFPPVAYTAGEAGGERDEWACERHGHRDEKSAPQCRGTAAGEWGDGRAGDSGRGGFAPVGAASSGGGPGAGGAGGGAQRAV
ncbi:MAG: GNAT family N-acetyltransferase [Phycisphaeraceae bacterium]|nr:GNAT family N-acetyltransferase [Phycisphaeraceae bacterium]